MLSIDDYNRSIALDPYSASTYANRGHTKYKLGQIQAAIDDYDRAITINPHFAGAYHNRGFEKAGWGDRQGAIADLTRSLELYLQQGQTDLYQESLELIQWMYTNER